MRADSSPPYGQLRRQTRFVRQAFHHRRLDVGVPLRDVQEATSYADLRTTRSRLDKPGTPSTSSPRSGAARQLGRMSGTAVSPTRAARLFIAPK